jgi:hypothetical protein
VSNFLIRVQLPDRPGALGAVASRIGSVGGDVVSIEILQRDSGVVVDELGVGLAGENLIDLLREEVLEVDGASIESLREVKGPIPDRNLELLDLAAELFSRRSPPELLELMMARVHRTLAAQFCAIVEVDGSGIVISEGEPPDDDWLELAAVSPSGLVERLELAFAPMAHAGKTLVVRRAVPVIRDRERRWISSMAELADYGWQDLS